MQEIRSIGAVGSRLFGDGSSEGGGGGRKLRPNNIHQQAFKCPRCDSLNTKFCYYNNYNLSQPRHFCKSCRRYWTKGGVLRNVPVGGGCRKTKRSNPKQANPTTETATIADKSTLVGPVINECKLSNSHTSSESSSLTATNTNTNGGPMEVVSGYSSFKLKNLAQPSGLVDPKALNASASHSTIFSEMGSFTSSITSTNEQIQFGLDSILVNEQSLERWEAAAVAVSGGSLGDQAVEVRSTGNEGFEALDYQELFDLPNTVDYSYWSQNQWSD